jgi:hypothetical protein
LSLYLTYFNGVGYQVWVWGTIPAGTGINSVDVSVDGGTASTINRTSNGTVVYNELYFVSPLLRDASHTIVVTNQGSNVNGNSEFMLDRFLFVTGDEVPVFPTTAGTSSSTSTSANSSSYVAIPYCENFPSERFHPLLHSRSPYFEQLSTAVYKPSVKLTYEMGCNNRSDRRMLGFPYSRASLPSMEENYQE